MATTMSHPVDLAPPSRAAQRKHRLLELENEQCIEDAKALKMTERPAPTSVSMLRPQPQALGFAVLTNARLASFNADDTIYVQRSPSSSTLSSSPLPTPTPSPYSYSPAPAQYHTPRRKRTRRRRKSQSPLEPILPILIISIISSAPCLRLPPLSNFNSTCAAVCNSIRLQAHKVNRSRLHRLSRYLSGLSASWNASVGPDRNHSAGDSAIGLCSLDFDLDAVADRRNIFSVFQYKLASEINIIS
ncbi:hypothetical protein DFH09DRAFT_1091592 [Mycena vulgaris]|nr:hypothetical protein DFH09DRAFT_1091592 [Mycena vulgaris]